MLAHDSLFIQRRTIVPQSSFTNEARKFTENLTSVGAIVSTVGPLSMNCRPADDPQSTMDRQTETRLTVSCWSRSSGRFSLSWYKFEWNVGRCCYEKWNWIDCSSFLNKWDLKADVSCVSPLLEVQVCFSQFLSHPPMRFNCSFRN